MFEDRSLVVRLNNYIMNKFYYAAVILFVVSIIITVLFKKPDFGLLCNIIGWLAFAIGWGYKNLLF